MLNILEHDIVKQCFLFACKHFLDDFILVVRSNKVHGDHVFQISNFNFE